MAQYDTVTKQVTEDITVTVSKKKGATAGDKLVAFLEWLSEKIVDPGYGQPEGGRPPRPDQGLPGQGGSGGGDRPDQGLPPGRPGTGGRPDQGLPGEQPGIDNTLPGQGGRPDQGLPGSQPHPDNELPKILGEHAKEIAKLILGKCMDCKDDGSAQPK